MSAFAFMVYSLRDVGKRLLDRLAYNFSHRSNSSFDLCQLIQLVCML